MSPSLSLVAPHLAARPTPERLKAMARAIVAADRDGGGGGLWLRAMHNLTPEDRIAFQEAINELPTEN